MYSSTLPNGPKVNIPASTTGLTYIQLSFLFVRMDYYSPNYPLNSKLQYSSSHVFTEASHYNREVALSQGDKSNYNQHLFALPDSPYLLYGLTAFTFNSQTNSSLFSVMVNMAKNSYWIISPSNSVQAVTISADMFIKNVMQICSAKQKEISLIASPTISSILPRSTLYSAVDVTQLVPLAELTSNLNAIVYRFGIGSSVSSQMVTFSNSFSYNLDPSITSATGYIRF